jgi:hypothetical protein
MSSDKIDLWLGGFNRNSSSPTTEQIAKLKDALETCGELLTEETRQHLQFLLRTG